MHRAEADQLSVAANRVSVRNRGHAAGEVRLDGEDVGILVQTPHSRRPLQPTTFGRG